jgi:hypothetical protein
MSKRWSQRSAWAVLLLASLAGWAAIAALLFMPVYDTDPTVADVQPPSDSIDVQPASRPNAPAK